MAAQLDPAIVGAVRGPKDVVKTGKRVATNASSRPVLTRSPGGALRVYAVAVGMGLKGYLFRISRGHRGIKRSGASTGRMADDP